jgi:hypothetical protein
VILLRRLAPLAGALALLVLAAAFALLAIDARAWQTTIARDDVRFSALHSRPDLWSSPAILPGDPGRAILGMGDGLSYRHALQLYWLSEVGVTRAAPGGLTQTRIDAQERLEALAEHAKTGAERSAADNLLGVMTITTPAANSATQVQTFARAGRYFRSAIAADPGAYPPRVNLELLLRLTHPEKSRFGKEARGGYGAGGAQGASPVGGGY